ncbi:peroxidasin isoform X2 [Glossina fuscipes]|uniref:Cell adhesion molecule-related/down-regulated by oncogenes n=1 Tax=Glossina fuscipes TaxID=7396 RepID=A0A8U0W7G3_9MUSC|nr:peroxidasin isoform X2 [Glossina fuscipes]
MFRLITSNILIELMLLFSIVIAPTFGFYCPTSCNCFQRTVRCIRARLTSIPKLPQDANVVDLRFNRFEELPANAFEGLTQVTTLFLNENEISYVEESAFDGLKSLRFLYLNNNRISRLPSNIFQQLKQLEAIYLDNNDIWQIDANTFSDLPRLNRLFVFNNKLTNVPVNAFNRLPSLKRLRLDDNPIDCNCGVYSLWRHHQQHPQRKAITIALTCETPASLYRYGFSNLQEYHFHCKKPEIITAPHDMHATTGETVELPCRMTGDPQPEIVWMQNTNEINADFAPKMQILPTGTLKIDAFNSNDIGIYECIGRNEVGETRTQPIRIMMMMMTPTTMTTTTMTLPKKGTNANNNNNNNNNQYGPYYSSAGGSHNDNNNNNNNNNNNVYVSNQLWHDQQHIETEEAQQHQLELNPRHTSKLATNTDNNRVEQHRSSSNTNSNNNNNIWHAYVLSSDATTQGPASNVTGLIEQAHPRFIHTPKDRVVAVSAIESLRLDCVAVGFPTPEIQWYFNGRLVAQSTDALRIQANGSLVITQPSLQMTGDYRCLATNPLGSIEANAKIEVKELPEILMAPQNQTIKIGKSFVLECDADGNPIPSITWQFNGAAVVVSQHLTLENENTELIVNNAQESDSGLYTCIAENENGRTTIAATVTVEGMLGIPRISIEPFNLEAFIGTTIELPCKAAEPSGIKLTWRKDGRLIDPIILSSEKYEISGTGSLFVKNVTIFDGGRYECSLKNEFGRATASALITIRSNVNLAPGDRYVRIAFAEAAKEIDMAINNTIDMLFSKRNRTRPDGQQATPNYGDLLRVFRFPNGEARQLARAAEIYERTLVNIRKHVLKGDNLSIESDRYEFRDLLSREHLHLVAELSGCMEHREMPNCTDMCFHSKYRSIDGTCNNLKNPAWGASLTAFRRLEKPIYENGFSMPVGWMKGKLYSGFPKPSSRLVSTSLISTKETTPDQSITHMVMQWGQFLDHDLDHAIPSVSSESWDGIDCKKTCEFASPCYPIEVPPNDPRIKNRRCIDVVRSSSICGSGMTSVFFDSIQHREQINQLTSYIDASQVYGFSDAFANELRNLTTEDGLLRVGVQFPQQREMLPFAAPQDGMDCRRNLDENQMNCFVAGDIRVNEQVGLLAMHTIWMREHNRIAIEFRHINPHWDGDTIYYETRKIVGAQMQHITYKHWLPLIIGESGMLMLGKYKGYDANVNPTISNEFATVALRFGHTLINPILHRLNSTFQPIPQGHLQLHKAFFAPWRIAYEGGVDPLMRGMFATAAKLKTPEQNLNTELTEKLFHTAHAVALDLAAINIQRGRDHGIPGYNHYRRFCNLTVATRFEDLANDISNKEVRDKLQELYGHPDNIDVWVGGVLEDQVKDGKVGPLFQCLLVEQFRRLRDGDRFYYENPTVFLPQQLEQIKQTSLARVLCDDGDQLEEVSENVFILSSLQGGYKKCEDIDGINLYFWQDCATCSSLPPLFDTYIPQTYKKTKRSKRSLATDQAEMEEIDLPQIADPHDNILDMFDVNEERVSGLEEVISSFQKELKKLHKKIHRLEETCEANNSNGGTGGGSNSGLVINKAKRNHCVDENGTTRLNNEVWTPDYCTKCECRRNQITCTREKCGEIHCEPGIEPLTPPMACCPHCPPLINKIEEIKT